MPLKIILQSPRSNIIFCNFLAAIVINAVLFNIPLYFQAVLLESATDSGLRLIIPSASATIAGVSTGFLISWSRRLKWPLVLGTVLLLVGTTCLSAMTSTIPSYLYLLFLIPGSAGQGFLYPGAFIALLSLSEQAEQAVVTSTMTLWRSLGMVLGVASSSLVVQNALVVYLNRFVTGEDKEDIVVKVRKNIQAIRDLRGVQKSQVIQAYAASLKLTFIVTAVLAALCVLIIIGIRVPRLEKRNLT
jgi:fucose permease